MIEQLIKEFLKDARNVDDNLFPFIANKKVFNKEKDSVYYSGPYWDDSEIEAIFYSILKGKWLSSGENVNKFERQFSKRFNKLVRGYVETNWPGWLLNGYAFKRELERYHNTTKRRTK